MAFSGLREQAQCSLPSSLSDYCGHIVTVPLVHTDLPASGLPEPLCLSQVLHPSEMTSN